VPYTSEQRDRAFWAKVRKSDGCWFWVGAINKKGYGTFKVGSKTVIAHRWAYGPVPEGLTLDHLCRVRHCVNPNHLEPVTSAENQRRGMVNQNKPKVACSRCGQPYDSEYQGANGNTWRRCTSCKRDYNRQLKRRLREKASQAGEPT
jgi:hypothetical protein